LSVLCTIKNNEHSIYESFKSICQDLKINLLVDSRIEFDELDDSILRILKSDKIEEIRFYHPSMEEFLIRQLINNESGKLREIVVKNLNLDLLWLCLIKPSGKSIIKTDKEKTIELNSGDVDHLETGLLRYINNQDISLYQASSIFKWFNSESHTVDLKLNDRPSFKSVKSIIKQLISLSSSDDFYFYHKEESSSDWANLFHLINSISTPYGFDLVDFDFKYIDELLNEKEEEELYWMIVLRSLSVTSNDHIESLVGTAWLNNFYTSLKADIYKLGYELFEDDFPKFAQYKKSIKKDKSAQKRKHKPNKTWYPRYLKVKSRIDVLKEVKGTNIGNRILTKLSTPYFEIVQVEEYAKKRHDFIVHKGWWSKEHSA